MGVIPMGEHYKSIFLSVIIFADKFLFVGMMVLNTSCNMLKMIIGTMTFKYTIFGNWLEGSQTYLE